MIASDISRRSSKPSGLQDPRTTSKTFTAMATSANGEADKTTMPEPSSEQVSISSFSVLTSPDDATGNPPGGLTTQLSSERDNFTVADQVGNREIRSTHTLVLENLTLILKLQLLTRNPVNHLVYMDHRPK